MTVDSVEVFDFDVTPANQATTDAIMVSHDDGTQDAQALGLGHEFLDRLQGAELVFFMGGDQWPYAQLLKGSLAAQRISSRNKFGFDDAFGTAPTGEPFAVYTVDNHQLTRTSGQSPPFPPV